MEIVVLEYVEDNTADTAGLQACFHGLDGDFGGFVVGEMEFSGGNAAEGNAFQMVFVRKVHAGAVAGF